AFHLEHARRQSVATYSRGMKQRLGLAVSFLPEPELFILDEPVSSLDPEGRREVFDVLRRLKGKATVFFSSHILDDVERISDLLVMLKDGQKVLEGAMDEVLTRYAPDRLRIGFGGTNLVRACEVLRGLPWVSRVTESEEPGVVYVDVAPTQIETAVGETLVHLVQQGLRVREYSRSKADLESVFLRIAEGKDAERGV
ncbi:MAG: ABC transporter ATP-binding protein, partial [Bacillota bacterium]